MWQSFTQLARKAVFFAREAAAEWGSATVEPEHLLLGLLVEQHVAGEILEALGVSVGRIRSAIGEPPAKVGAVPSNVTLSKPSKRAIDQAYAQARDLGDNYIGTEHLLLGLLDIPGSNTQRILAEVGATLDGALSEVRRFRGGGQAKGKTHPASSTPLSPEALLAILSGRCLGEHLLMTLLAERDSATRTIVAAQSVDVAELQRQLWFRIGEESRKGLYSGQAETVAELLARAQEEAGSAELKSHHLLLALLRDSGPLGAILTSAGLDLDTSRRAATEGA